jgi:site-specific DNA recombinase
MRVYTYARYSTERQTEASIIDQQRRCHQYAVSRGWQVAADFTDEGISGAALGNRPGFHQAMAALQPGDVLLAADLTRLSRSQELAPLLDRLRFRGVRIVGVLDGFDSESPQARMQAGLSGLMSDELRASIRVRTHSALQMRATAGRPTGGKVYGYDRAGQIIEAEAIIVREIFERMAAGEPMRKITNDLNARGIPSPGARWSRSERRHDGRWLISALNAMLQNERYAGRLIWNRSVWVKDPDTGKRVRRERPQSEWTTTECSALVEASTWDKVQVRMRERATGSRHGSGVRRYILSGLLVCEHCGSRFIATGKNGSHYICSTHTQGGEAACPVASCISRSLAEDIVLAPVQRELLAPDAVEHACELIRGWARNESIQIAEGANPEVEAIAAEIADLEALIEARPARTATLRQVIEDLRARQANLQRGARRQAHAKHGAEIPAEQAYRAAVAEMAATLEGGNIEAARVALHSLVGTIPVFEDAGKLYGRIGLDPTPLYRSRNPQAFCAFGHIGNSPFRRWVSR